MLSYRRAVLREVVDSEPSFQEVEGEALILISRTEHGRMEASGTFKSSDKRLHNSVQLPKKLFQYQGVAFEGDKGYEIMTFMFIKSNLGELFELESSTEPVIVTKSDITGKPVKLTDLLDYSDEVN